MYNWYLFGGLTIYALIGLAYWSANWGTEYQYEDNKITLWALRLLLVLCLALWPVLFLFRLFLKLFVKIGA